MSTGFKDPDGAFPRPEYIGQATTNKAARDEWTPKIVLPDGVAGTDLVKMDWQPEYPYNKVEETSSGHRVEHDDTLGNERLSYVHKDGSGIEMYPNAEEQTTVLVNSVGRMVQLVGDDFVMIVNGNGDVTYKGNLNLNVEGDFNVSCNNYTITTKGKNVEETKQQKIENFVGDRVVTTQGNKSEIVLGNYTVESMGNTYLVSKENTRITAQDNIDIFAGDDMRLTADGRMTSSALVNRVVGICTSVVGNTGTFGGKNIVMYSKSHHTDTVNATTIRSSFVGDLKGDVEGNLQGNADTATEAGKAGTAAVIGAGGSGGTPADPNVTEVAATTTYEPNFENLSEGLARTVQLAIRQIDVDDTGISNSVHGGGETGGSSGQSGNIPSGYEDEFDDQFKAAPYFKSNQEFYDAVYDQAYQEYVNKGYNTEKSAALADLAAAQASLESGYGTKSMGGTNYFGIKSPNGTVHSTKEVINGEEVTIQAGFANHGSLSGSVSAYVDLINRSPYGGVYDAVKASTSPLEAIQAIDASPYATDPKYGSKLRSIYSTYGRANK